MARALVGPSGRVVAVDLDTRFLSDIDQPNVDVIKADFLSDAPTAGSFDLVLTRFALFHLPDPKQAIDRMVQLAKPNGWVFAVDCDLCNLSAADPSHRNAGRFDDVYQRRLAYHCRGHHSGNPALRRPSIRCSRLAGSLYGSFAANLANEKFGIKRSTSAAQSLARSSLSVSA